MKKAIFILIFLFCSSFTSIQHAREKYYQKIFSTWISGQTEVTLSDRTRVDVVTAVYAIEVEFASKWSNSIGQALYYASITGLSAGIVIIRVTSQDDLNIKRLLQVCGSLPIKIWLFDHHTMRISKLNF